MNLRRLSVVAVCAVLIAACAPQAVTPPPPLISGSPEVGSALTVTTGAWTNQPTSFTYRWERCSTGAATSCSPVGTGATYTVVVSDVGSWIRVTVTAKNQFGNGSTKTGAVGPVTDVGGTTTEPTTSTTSTSTTSTTTSTTSTTTTTLVDPNNQPPVIQGAGFFSGGPARPVPFTSAFGIGVSDPDGDDLVCDLDLDANGTYEHPVEPCALRELPGGTGATAAVTTVTLNVTGTIAVGVRVSDGINPPVTSSAYPIELTAASEPFDITLDVEPGAFTPSQLAALNAAVAKWEQVLGSGIPSTVADVQDSTLCPDFSGAVDDLRISVGTYTSDGPGNFLAFGGYCGWRTDLNYGSFGAFLPSYGAVNMDEADLTRVEDDDHLTEVFAHEIGHVLGLGTSSFWESAVVESTPGDPRLRDYSSSGAWEQLGGAGEFPPVANVGAVASTGVHWRESDLQLELMTPSLGIGIPGDRPLSILTLAFLASFGYSLDLADADAFTLPEPTASARVGVRADEFKDGAFGPGVG